MKTVRMQITPGPLALDVSEQEADALIREDPAAWSRVFYQIADGIATSPRLNGWSADELERARAHARRKLARSNRTFFVTCAVHWLCGAVGGAALYRALQLGGVLP